MIAVIDYGLGNLFSLSSSLKAVGAKAVITADPAQIRAARRLILPGVGAFGDAMARLDSSGLTGLIREQARQGKPLLGICLGMQLLFQSSREFGLHQGLGLLQGDVAPLAVAVAKAGLALKTPHMGWNSLLFQRPDCPLLHESHEGEYMYFVHSYYVRNCGESLTASADYGIMVPALVWQGHIYGCQFHPEKSGAAGLRILQAFATGEAAGQ
ncbi:MAG: imidazole glycerol phosphate synthase subunit HisH [Clostridia bacterium]|nr:imidazole glycerol phosphate synthase subunit HisH [Clostridia bacterium]